MTSPQPSGQADELVRALSADGGIAIRSLVGTRLVAEAADRHRTSPTASAVLGRSLMGALLLAADAREGASLQLQLRGDGPAGTVTAIADTAGRVRGFVARPRADLPAREGKLDVGGAVGKGILAVVRSHPSWREPVRGIVPLVSGEVAEDLAHYLTESEQIQSAVSLGVYEASDGRVEAAGGFLVQALPEASEATLARVERNVRGLPPSSAMVRAGVGAGEIAERLLAGIGSRALAASRPRFHCPCGRERVLRAVALLGRDEVLEIAARREAVEVFCEFCRERYAIEGAEVAALLDDA